MTRFGALFTRESLCACSALIDIPAAPRRPEQDEEITGEGEEEGRVHSGRGSLVVGGGAGHPIATIYFPSAARNTSGQEEWEGEGRHRSRVNK